MNREEILEQAKSEHDKQTNKQSDFADSISRQAAIDALKAIRCGLWEIDIPSPAGCHEYVEHHEQIQHMMGVVDGWIKKISEEEPTDRNGHWIDRTEEHGDSIGIYPWEVFKCSECGHLSAGNEFKYCPYCGADMRGVDDESTL